MNQGIGPSVPENWRRRGWVGGGGHNDSYQGGTFEWGVEIFKGGLTPWRTPCMKHLS